MSLHEQILTSLGRGPDKTFARLTERVGPEKAAAAVVKAGLDVIKAGLRLSDEVTGELNRAREEAKQQAAEIEALKRSCETNAGQVAPLASQVKALEGQVAALKASRDAQAQQATQDSELAQARQAELAKALEESAEAVRAAKAAAEKAQEERLDVVAQAEGLRTTVLRLEAKSAELAKKAAQRDQFFAELQALKKQSE